MRLPARPVAALLVLVIGLVATAVPARADMGRPEWHVGDFWSYSFTGTFSTATIFTLAGPGTFRMDVVGTDTVTVGGGTYPSHRVRLTANASGATVLNGGEHWYRVSDLGLVKSVFNVTASIPPFGEVTVIATLTYEPPLGMRWPLTASANWSANTTLRFVNQILGGPQLPALPIQITVQTAVQASATVTVAAGSFETTPVREDTGGHSSTYWAPGAGNYARRQEFDSGGTETYSAELREYRYQGPGFLGLPYLYWFFIIVALIVIIAAVASRSRRRKGPTV